MTLNQSKNIQNKKIGLITSISFAVGAMIGGGVFVLSGLALKQTGASAIVSFIIAGIMVLFSAISFAKISSQKNKGNYSGYAIVGQVLKSHIWTFLVSWSFYLAGIIGAAFVLNAFGIYLTSFVLHNNQIVLWAIIFGILLTLINLGPASEIGRIETLLVGLKIIALVILIGFGIANFHLSYLHPFTPHGQSQILVSSAFLFIAFLGFNVITNIASEIKKPTKTIPLAIILSMLIVMVIYVGIIIALISAHIHNYDEASVGVAAKNLIGPIGEFLIVLGALVSTLSSANANILGSSEIMVRMALDKQVPTSLAKQYKGHPLYSVLFGGLLYIILILTKKTDAVIGLANITAIFGLIIVNITAFKLYLNSNQKLMASIPIIGSVFGAIQFLFMPFLNVMIGFSIILLGLLIYRFRNRLHSQVLHQELIKIFNQVSGPLTRSLRKN